MSCVYCFRVECAGCPLRFDDKVTLRQVLESAGVPTHSSYFYNCADIADPLKQRVIIENTAENDKKKKSKKKNKQKKSKKEPVKGEVS